MSYRINHDLTDDEYQKLKAVLTIGWNTHSDAKEIMNKITRQAVYAPDSKKVAAAETPKPRPATPESERAERIMKAMRGVAGSS